MGVSGISSVAGGAPGDPPEQPVDDPAELGAPAPAEGASPAQDLPADGGHPDAADPVPRPAGDDRPAPADAAPVDRSEPSPPEETAHPADAGDVDAAETTDLPSPGGEPVGTPEPVPAGPVASAEAAPPVPTPAEDVAAGPEVDEPGQGPVPAEDVAAGPEVDEPGQGPVPAEDVAAEPAPEVLEAVRWEPAPVVEPAEPAVEHPWSEAYPPARTASEVAAPPPAPTPTRRPRPGPAPRPSAGEAPQARPAAGPSPRPRPAAPAGRNRAQTRAAARAAGTEGARAASSAPVARGASAAAPRPARRRRRWPVLLAAVLAVAVLAAGAVWGLGLLGDRGDGPVAEQVPDAVLPDLARPAPALAELSAQAPAPDPAVLSAVLTPLLAAPALGSGLSAQVVDVDTGEVLFDRAGTDPGTPASTAKLLTAVAVLTTLDPESTLTTRVVAGTAPGEVVLVGAGDPTLSTTDPSQAYPGAATVSHLAAQVQAELAGTLVTRVVVDQSLFEGPLTAPGWQPDDAPSTYAAPVTAAAVDGARVDPAGTQRSGQPGTDAGSALAAALGAPSAEVVLGTAPAGGRTLGTVESAPLQRLVEQALTYSDNLLSESLARHVALARGLPATFAGAAQAVSDAVADAGLDTTGLTLVDASGLSDLDRAPARLLVDAVRTAADGTVPEAAGLLAGLPVAGYTGTLAERAVPDVVPGAVRAKTGTLLSVHDLAGSVVTSDGRLLAFAVLADGTAGSRLASESALDVVAAALARCGCR